MVKILGLMVAVVFLILLTNHSNKGRDNVNEPLTADELSCLRAADRVSPSEIVNDSSKDCEALGFRFFFVSNETRS